MQLKAKNKKGKQKEKKERKQVLVDELKEKCRVDDRRTNSI